MFYRLGLIGQNISYSLSPRIHEWGLKKLGLQGEYRLLDVSKDKVETLILKGEWDGLNITVPHKTLAAKYCAELSSIAEQVGAINVLYKKDVKICGDNFDGFGFKYALTKLNDNSREITSVLIIGSGGAARAVIGEIQGAFPKSNVAVTSRNTSKVNSTFTAHQNNSFLSIISFERAAANLSEFDLIIQATPVGSHRIPGVPLPEPFSFSSRSLVMDLIYSPARTEFLLHAERFGAIILNGLPMLLGQAAESFRLWTGREFPIALAENELMPLLESR